MNMKKIVYAVVAVVCVAALVFLAYRFASTPEETQNPMPAEESQTQAPPDVENDLPAEDVVAENQDQEVPQNETYNSPETLIGKSAGGTEIIANHYGNGSKEILFIGGIHGGYSFNTVLLAEKLANNLFSDSSLIPANIKVTIIQNLNPDGSYVFMNNASRFNSLDDSEKLNIRTEGRFNANNVDLNRNFDCNWQPKAVWQNKPVSAGSAAFSEPESRAVRDYAQSHSIAAVVAWYSSGGGVYSSSCNNGILPETQTITDLYAKASGYPAYKNFESYQISGDMTDWFAKNNVPAISVILNTSEDEEWDKNWAGIEAILDHYGK